MTIEAELIPKVDKYFSGKGWKVLKEAKVRGRTVDILANKGGLVAAVEVKANIAHLQRAIEYALHQKHAVNLSYLAVPSEQASQKVKKLCRNLGIGLLLIDQRVREEVKPTYGRLLPSVGRAIAMKGVRKQEAQIVTIRSSLEKIFRSRAQILILKLLLLNSKSEFHLHDIARKTRVSPPSVAKECGNLVSMGLVERRKQGNLVFFRINTKSVIYDELKRIFMKYEFFDEVIKEELPSGVEYALIYGSYAKGKEEVRSDIDLLVIGKVDEDKLLRAISKLERKIGREVNYNLWSKDEFREKAKDRIPLLNDILKTPTIMIVGEESEFKRIIREASR